MSTTLTDETTRAVDFLNALFANAPLKEVGFELWNGTQWPDEAPRTATIILKHPGTLWEMFHAGHEKGMADAFLNEHFDIVGDIEAALELADALEHRKRATSLTSLKKYLLLHTLPHSRSMARPASVSSGLQGRRHSLERDKQAVSAHYDLSNDFFRLWLDARMVYSCAYFARPNIDLDEAQLAKFDHTLRKLRLQPGQRLLDIGCGWGALALYAAQNFGVTVHGVTLSKAQAEWATSRISLSGLSDRVTIEIRDYRQLNEFESYDAIVSVGMQEHVGSEQLQNYFRHISRLLKPGGLFLNHAIGQGIRQRNHHGPSFIDEYVFPDSEIPPLPPVLQAAESAAFEIRDVENLREHYMLTLRQWVKRLEAQHDEALKFVNETTYRTWRLYMAGSAHGFARGHLAIYQTLLAKPDNQGRVVLPLTRSDLYSVYSNGKTSTS